MHKKTNRNYKLIILQINDEDFLYIPTFYKFFSYFDKATNVLPTKRFYTKRVDIMFFTYFLNVYNTLLTIDYQNII